MSGEKRIEAQNGLSCVGTLTIGKARKEWREQAYLRSAAVLHPPLERYIPVSTTSLENTHFLPMMIFPPRLPT